ncbi:MAG: SDR family NAD(P)-dependent oxidoreductase [Deltaproteobacteria bacterium]|nr:MAG: SDR family NAD(P)-dependent oxidoreductase [Deltaproteobacteria bacterium]
MSEKLPPIAIVGMSSLLPGAPDLTSYWRAIVHATDGLSDIPADHSWSPDDFFDADPKTPDKTWATRGGFIDKVPFDPMDHGVIPHALEAIDTDQLLALIVARECLRDAGLDPDGEGWDRDRTSVILGHTSTNELVVDLSARLHGPTWRRALQRNGVPESVIERILEDVGQMLPTWQEQSFPGMLANVSAGRIANRLDLGGTNATVDAACASALGALHYAIGELQTGRTDLALSGGTDTLNDIFMYMCFSKTPALSRRGDSRPFDVDGDGIVISEGIAMFALKRLADAERDGDRIYAVIRGIGTSSDGRNKSIYAPNSGGQVKAVRRAYAEAGFPLESVELIEAHGTGTKAGDLAEFNALRAVFLKSERDEAHVALGSVKSQIGHTKATAGAAGLMKIALALHQRVLPPTAKIRQPSPRLDFEGTPLYLNTEARPWVRSPDSPRRAGVSAFGFGGTNYHFAVEEYGESRPTALIAEQALFLFGAETTEALKQSLEAVDLDGAPTLHHAAHAVLERWTPGPKVIAFCASTLDEARDRLRIAHELARADQPAERGGVRFALPLKGNGKIGVVFPGQGSQYVNMGRTTALRHPALIDALDQAEAALKSSRGESLARRIYPPPAFTPAERKGQTMALRETAWAQPALGALEVGLWRTLERFGVKADAFAGHSYGELVALHAAGVWSSEALWTLSDVRGSAMSEGEADRGTMAALKAPLDKIEALIADHPQVTLANRNHPKQGVIAGPREAVHAVLAAAEAQEITGTELQVSAAFHSPLVRDARAPLFEALGQIQVEPPSVPVFANVSAAPYPDDPAQIRSLIADQVTHGVDWVGVVRAMANAGVTTFVECGPKSVLSRLIQRCLPDRTDIEVVCLDPDHGETDGDALLKRALMALACRGVAIDVSPILEERLPSSPRTAGSKATVWLAGANFKRPVELPERDELFVRPSPTRPVARVHAGGSLDAPASPSTAVNGSYPDTDTAGPLLFTPPSDADLSQGQTMTTSPPRSSDPSPLDSEALASLIQATRESLTAFQQTQARTAEVHAEFLRGQAKANETFTELFRSQTQLLGGKAPLAASVPAVDPAPAPIEGTHDALAEAVLRPTDPQRATTLDMPRNDGPRVRDSQDLPPMLSAQTLASAIKEGQPLPSATRHRAAPPPETTTQAPAVDPASIVLQIVSEKTGYPTDLLQPQMDLESDLGVDSIKRVEILAALQDALPQAPEIPEDELGSIRTLADLEARLRSPSPEPAGAKTATARSADLAGTVLTLVAEKTGYPRDLLGVAMELEGDLGIDSIKRVEILSAIAEALPDAPELPEEELSGLRTLGDIIEALSASEAPPVSLSARAGARPAKAPPTDVDGTILQTIADRTGYPVDLLQPSMELEGDLGIDSIKRVEIFSALAEALPGLPDLPEDEIARVRTLRDLLALVKAHREGSTPPEPAAPATAAALPEPPRGALRREVVIVPAPDGEGITLPSPLILTRDRLGMADKLAAALRERGVQPRVIDPDWASLTTVGEQVPPSTSGIVHLAALGAVGKDLEARVRGAFLLAKLAPSARFFATVSGLGGTFGHERSDGEPLQGALAGLVKTLEQERPPCRALAVDIDEGVDPHRLAEELMTDRGVVEIGLSDEAITLEVVPVTLHPSAPVQAPLRAGDLVVVSGGARGVTSAVVREMAKRWSPTLLLLGRSAVEEQDPAWARGVDDQELKPALIGKMREEQAPFDPRRVERELAQVRRSREVRSTLNDLKELGCEVTYAAVDVTDSEAVRAAVAKVSHGAGPVRGVVHGAGIIADKLIADKSLADFDRVYQTKVEGLRSLLATTSPQDLKLLAVFSSVAGRYGNRGQADYAMANEAITHLCHAWRHAGVPGVKAFHWGPWDGGMVTPTLAAAFEARGLALVGQVQGAEAFCEELERGGPAVEVVIGGPDSPSGLLGQRPSRAISDASEGEETIFLRAEQTFLADHRIDGKPVLPFVMALELMADAARRRHPELRFVGMREVAVLKGVVLEDDEIALTLSWRPTSPALDGGLSLAFELRGAPNKLGLPTVHYRGTVDLAYRAASGDRFPGSNGLGAVAYPYAVGEAYQRFLFHGPGFQGIEDILGMSDHGIVGQLSASKPKRLGVDATTWTTDPVTLDSALQLVGLWVREHQGASALPSYVGRYTQTAPFRGPISAHIEFKPGKSRQGHYDATFVDGAGRVVARIEGGQYTSMQGLNERYREGAE